MPNLVGKIIGKLCGDLHMDLHLSCCNKHIYKSGRLSTESQRQLHLEAGEIIIVIGKKVLKFPDYDSLHKYIHEHVTGALPLQCSQT